MLGVCYYPEHWPKHYWQSDAEKMYQLGLRYVRIGEFAWHCLEPAEGDYQFAWLDEAIDTLGKAGLQVILGTPTATPPKWLIDKYPDILPVDIHSGRQRGFGSRRHYDFSSEQYLFESIKITQMLAKRYGGNPYVVGWQTDNELCCHDTTHSASDNALRAFRAWCKVKYQDDIAQLNKAWGNVFWSMAYNDFEQIELPLGAVTEVNPAHALAFRRFSSDQVVQYHQKMVEAIRQEAPQQFITHNFIPPSETNVDNFALAQSLDLISFDNYPLGRTGLFFADWPAEKLHPYLRTGHPDFASFYHDQVRCLNRGDYWIMEQQPGPVNWAQYNPKPLPGMVRLWTLEAFAHGAACVCYFRWRQAPFAQEQMHAGLLRPDNSHAEAWPEIQQVHREITDLKLDQLPRKKSAVAILINIESQWICDIEQQGLGYAFWQVQFDYYQALRRIGVDVDYIDPSQNFDDYKLIIVPNLAIINEATVEKIRHSSCHFIFGPRSGAKTAEFSQPETLPPGPLQQLLACKVLCVETMHPACHEPFSWQGQSYTWHSWREDLAVNTELVQAQTPTGAPILITQNNLSYLAALTDVNFLCTCLRSYCEQLGIAHCHLPEDLRISRRGNLVFVFNYSRQTHSLTMAPDTATFLLGGRDIAPQGVSIWQT